MGQILAGIDETLGREVAIKIVHGEHRGDRSVIQRFVEEAQIGGQLQHPGIVPVYELGRSRDYGHYFAMKRVRGRTLADLLAGRAHPRQDLSRMLSIFEKVSQTLAYAHSKGVIHRDLKPSNIMVGEFGEVLVMDWGVAKVLRADREEEGEEPVRTTRSAAGQSTIVGGVTGTPAFMAPEQARGLADRLDERADVFGLGALLCVILTGRPPYEGDEPIAQAKSGDLDHAYELLDESGSDPELIGLAKRCLHPDPSRRPCDATEVAQAVASYQRGVEERLRASELQAAKAQAKAAEELKRRKLAVRFAWALSGTIIGVAALMVWIASDLQDRLADLRQSLAYANQKAADAAKGDHDSVKLWEEAKDAAGAASKLCGKVWGDSALARSVSERLSQSERNLNLIQELDQIRMPKLTAADLEFRDDQRMDQDYLEAFRKWGVPVFDADPESVAAEVRTWETKRRLVVALEEWAIHCRDADARRKLLDIAERMDPLAPHSSWRQALADGDIAALRREAGAILSAERSISDSRLLFLAVALKKLGDEGLAIRILEHAETVRPDDFWVLLQLGYLRITARPPRYEKAIRCFQAASALRPDSSQVHCDLAVALLYQRELPQAESRCRQAIRLDKNNVFAWINLGVIQAKLGKSVEAIRAQREALALDPSHPRAADNLIRSLIDADRQREALDIGQEAIVRHPVDARLRSAWGLAWASLRKTDQAMTAFREALTLDPALTEASSQLASMLATIDRHEEAAAVCAAALKQRPSEVFLIRQRIAALRSIGDINGAVVACEELLRQQPGDPDALYNLASCRLRASDSSAAVQSALKAVQAQQPPSPKALYAYGLALKRACRFEESVERLETAASEAQAQGHSGLARSARDAAEECRRFRDWAKREIQGMEMTATARQERLELAYYRFLHGRSADAARLFELSFCETPDLSRQESRRWRYNAACAAALAGFGRSADSAPLTEDQRKHWRGQALRWLIAELDTAQGQDQDRRVARRIRPWLSDSDLEVTRDPGALGRLSSEERAEWRGFWARIETIALKPPILPETATSPRTAD